jgi:DNA-binding NarL/FixJ family response regulator
MGLVRVLLVDDQPMFLRALISVVEETPGFAVAGTASSGEQCLTVAGEVHPQLVLMDVNLPGRDGLETTRRLRRSESPPVVLLLSTYDEEVADRFTSESGAAAYVTKSAFGPERLEGLWAAAAAR